MMQKNSIKLIECPRDAMQGWKSFIPTEQKVNYLNALLKVGFHSLDFGSFVSPKAIPQMADTKTVVSQLQMDGTNTRLLAIVANERGAADALSFEQIGYLGFPLSVSETFQQLNTNASIEEALGRVEAIQNLCIKNNRQLVVYLSMGFGNPYGDAYNENIVINLAHKLAGMDIKIISLADTVGLANAQIIGAITKHLITSLPDTEIGVHLHSTSHQWQQKLDAALQAGCIRFDGALKGIGGCPMANNQLVGNMDTELMIPYFESLQMLNNINAVALQNSSAMAAQIFV